MTTATWTEKNLTELLPPQFQVLATAVGALTSVVNTMQSLQAVAAALIPPVDSFTISPGALVAAAASELIDEILAFQASLRNTGITVLAVEPIEGGSRKIEEQMFLCLSNELSPERPFFDENSWQTLFGVMIEAEDVTVVKDSFEKVLDVFTSTRTARDFTTGPQFVSLDKFVDSYFAQQLARTAKPIPRCTWIGRSLEDFLPREAAQQLRDSERLLEGLIAYGQTDPLVQYIEFLTANLDRILEDIQEILALAAALNDVFVDVSIRTFVVDPFQGGTEALLESLPDIFGVSSSFEHSPRTTIVSSVLMISGAPIKPPVQATADLVNILFF